MKAQLSLVLGLVATHGALASVLERAVCNADNCARAVTGTRIQSNDLSSRMSDCSSFMQVVVTPATVTVNVTATPPAVRRRNADGGIIQVRQETVLPTNVPAYASACSGAVRYSSACSCAGITQVTTTVSAPVVTATVTPTPPVCNGTNLLTDPQNCGTCGNVCPSGTCVNGACSSSTCTAQTCANFGPCGPGGSCVCASTFEGTGFCVEGSTPCAGLAECVTSVDCASGEVCAVGTCCGNNVCIGATTCGGAASKRSFPPLKRGPGVKSRGDPDFGTVGGVPPSS